MSDDHQPGVLVRSVAILGGLLLATAAAVWSAAEPFPTSDYELALARHVDQHGLVDYAGLKADLAPLDRFVADMASLDPTILASWSLAERLAFWINAYNALTLKAIVDHYPIHASSLSALRFPHSSIRQISGVWSSADHTVAGKKLSLDDIEHHVIRMEFHEPRVHMALVCAALGCPPLRREPYVGARLFEQLDDQARRYLATPAGLREEPGSRGVEVSSIFKWFAEDFPAVKPPAGAPPGLTGVRAFLYRYAPETARPLLADRQVGLSYLDYDWTLNDSHEE